MTITNFGPSRYPINIQNLERYLEKLKELWSCGGYLDEKYVEKDKVVRLNGEASFEKVFPICYNASNEDLQISGEREEQFFIDKTGIVISLWRLGGRGPLQEGGIIHILDYCLKDEKYKHDLERVIGNYAFYAML